MELCDHTSIFVVFDRQYEYYAALKTSDKAGNSTTFIEFMLTAIADVLAIQNEHKDKHQVEQLSDLMVSILKALENKSLSRKEIFMAIGMKNDHRSFKRNILKSHLFYMYLTLFIKQNNSTFLIFHFQP